MGCEMEYLYFGFLQCRKTGAEGILNSMLGWTLKQSTEGRVQIV